MKSPTSSVVTSLDIFVVVNACFFGTLCGLFGIKNTQELNRRLTETDTTLAAYSNTKKDGRKSIFMLIVILLTLTIILILDIMSWLRTAAKLKTKIASTCQSVWPKFYQSKTQIFLLFQLTMLKDTSRSTFYTTFYFYSKQISPLQLWALGDVTVDWTLLCG